MGSMILLNLSLGRRLARPLVLLCLLSGLGSPFLIRGFAQPSPSWPSLETTLVVGSLSLPVEITHAGDDSDRLFIVEQGGKIRIFRGGSLLAAPFLDLSSTGADRVLCCGERGLLRLAFS